MGWQRCQMSIKSELSKRKKEKRKRKEKRENLSRCRVLTSPWSARDQESQEVAAWRSSWFDSSRRVEEKGGEGKNFRELFAWNFQKKDLLTAKWPHLLAQRSATTLSHSTVTFEFLRSFFSFLWFNSWYVFFVLLSQPNNNINNGTTEGVFNGLKTTRQDRWTVPWRLLLWRSPAALSQSPPARCVSKTAIQQTWRRWSGESGRKRHDLSYWPTSATKGRRRRCQNQKEITGKREVT